MNRASQPSGGRAHIVVLAGFYRTKEGPGTAAEIRARGLATGLSALGHSVTVISAVPRGAEPVADAGIDVIPAAWLDLEALAGAAGLQSTTLVQTRGVTGSARRTRLRAVVSKVLIDRHTTWVPAAIVAARRAARRDSIIFSTGSRSAHLAARLARGRRRWIADINDLWASTAYWGEQSLQTSIDSFLERNTIGTATRLTTVNDMMREELERRYFIPTTTIFSGYDPADFEQAATPAEDSAIRVVFGGTLYRTLNLSPLLRALQEGKRAGWLTPAVFQLSFIGRWSERARFEAEELGVSDLVTAHGLIPRRELLQAIGGADALLLPLYENDPYALPMRFFEYVGAGRPIIGFGPRDRLAGTMITDNNLGVVVSDEDEITQLLRRLVVDRERLPRPEGPAQRQFTWEPSIDKLRQVLAEVGVQSVD